MKLWLITNDDSGYDQFDSLLVRAESEEAALGMLRKECWRRANGMTHDHWDDSCATAFPGFKPDGSNAKVEEVTPEGEAKLIIGSFNAG